MLCGEDLAAYTLSSLAYSDKSCWVPGKVAPVRACPTMVNPLIVRNYLLHVSFSSGTYLNFIQVGKWLLPLIKTVGVCSSHMVSPPAGT